MRLAALLSCALWLAGCDGAPSAEGGGFPPEVEARIAQERAMCADGLGELEPVSREALQQGEFNADGAPDYVLSHEAFRCTEGGFLYCGSAGCSFTVFMSKPEGGLDLVEMSNAQAVSIVRDGDRDVLDLALHGRLVGAQTEYVRLRWDGARFEPQMR
jgi:hypothetical protein